MEEKGYMAAMHEKRRGELELERWEKVSLIALAVVCIVLAACAIVHTALCVGLTLQFMS